MGRGISLFHFSDVEKSAIVQPHFSDVIIKNSILVLVKTWQEQDRSQGKDLTSSSG